MVVSFCILDRSPALLHPVLHLKRCFRTVWLLTAISV